MFVLVGSVESGTNWIKSLDSNVCLTENKFTLENVFIKNPFLTRVNVLQIKYSKVV